MSFNASKSDDWDDQWVEDYFWEQWDLLNEETMDEAGSPR